MSTAGSLTKQVKLLPLWHTYLLPFEEKQRLNISSRALLNTLKLGKRETRQMHLSAYEFACIR